MDKEIISVIVPVYNVQQYIEQCVESILSQTYTNLEIILVDDGSSDNCPAICDSYAEEDSRIRVIHKQNGGLSDARNVGVARATGDYIGFVDSDDWIDNTMYETLYSLIKKYDADISEVGIKYQYANRTEYVKIGNTAGLSRDEAMCGFLDRTKNIQGSVWGKLYKASIAKKLEFPVGKLHEDGYYTYKAIYAVNRYAIGVECLYNYRQNRKGSIMSTQILDDNQRSRTDIIEAFEERNSFFHDLGESVFESKAKAYYYRTLITYLRKSNIQSAASEKMRVTIAKKVNSQHMEILKNPNLHLTWKIKYLCLRVIDTKIFREWCHE